MSEYDPLADAEELGGEGVDNDGQGIYPSEELDEGVRIPTIIESRTLIVCSYLSAAAAPYLIFLPAISLVVPAMKRSPWMRFHAWNSLLLHVAVTAAVELLNLTGLWFTLMPGASPDPVNIVSLVRWVLVPTAAVLYSAQLAYDAAKRRPTHIPLISSRAHRLAKDEEDEELPETDE